MSHAIMVVFVECPGFGSTARDLLVQTAAARESAVELPAGSNLRI